MTERRLSRRQWLAIMGSTAPAFACGVATALGMLRGCSRIVSVPEFTPEPTATPFPSPTATEQPVNREALHTNTTEYGFNTHLHAGAQDHEHLSLRHFKENVDWLAQRGQQWIRFNVRDFEVCSGTDGEHLVWNEENLDRYTEAVDYAVSKGLKIYLVTNPPKIGDTLTAFQQTTKKYYERLCTEMRGKIHVWQIFNEPDVHHYYNYKPILRITPSYLEELEYMVSQANAVIKAVDPNSRTTLNLSRWVGQGGNFMEKAVTFFDKLGKYVDVLTVDFYPDLNEAEMRRLPEYVAQLSHRYGKRVMVGELGLPTQTGAGYTETDQAYCITRSLEYLQTGLVKPEAVMVYELTNEEIPGNEGAFGLISLDGQEKQSVPAVLECIERLQEK